MPVSIRFADDGRGVIMSGTGLVTGEEVLNADKEAYAHATRPLLYQFIDGDGITGVNISSRDLHDIADEDIGSSKDTPECVVAIYASEDLPFALARVWQVYVERSGWQTNVFRTRAEAVAWLKEQVAAKFSFEATLE